MESISPFDLNNAVRHWLEQLGQSPQVKAENLDELESHVRDSVDKLQTKGLSAEESFLVATHRVGSPAKLEPEFAKVNRSPRNIIIRGLILVFFSAGCWFLWAMLNFPRIMTQSTGVQSPAFTRMMVGCGAWLAVPPLLAAIYCVYVWARRSQRGNSWVGFFASTVAVLILLTMPVLIAVLLPVIDFMNRVGVGRG